MLDDKYKVSKPCVYFITDGEYVKIGVSRCLENRFNTLQSANPRELSVMAVIYPKNIFEIESYYHLKYKGKRLHGEWFDIKAEVEQLIEESQKRKREEELRKEEERAEAAAKAAAEEEARRIEAEKNKYNKYYTTEELAKALTISVRLVKKMMMSYEDFPKVKRIGDSGRIKKSEFWEFLDRQVRSGNKKLI